MNTYWDQFKRVDPIWHHLFAFVLILIGIVGVFANVLVLVFLIKVKSFGKASSYFLINLAVSDLFKLVGNVPIFVYNSFFGDWMFNHAICNIYGFFGGFSGFLSITTLAVMSIERYLIVKNPLFALRINSQHINWSLAFIWVYSLLCSAMPLLSNDQYVLEGFRTSCTFDYISRDFMPRLTIIVLTIFGFVVPFTLIVVFYSLIWRVLLFKNHITAQYLFRYEMNSRKPQSAKNRLNLSKMSSSSNFKMNTDINVETPLDNNYNTVTSHDVETVVSYNRSNEISMENRSKLRKMKDDSIKINRLTKCGFGDDFGFTQSFTYREIRVAKTILLIVALFVLSWTPYVAIAFTAQFAPSNVVPSLITPFTAVLPAIFAKASSIYNPIIFTLTNRECFLHFKRVFKENGWVKGFFHKKNKKPQRRLLKQRNTHRS